MAWRVARRAPPQRKKGMSKAMNRKETFWYVLLWASFVAAAVSLLTTGIGLRRYLS